MSAKSCVMCNAALDGWVYDAKIIRDGRYCVNQGQIVAWICRNCGAAVCRKKHDKEIKGSDWTGRLDKAVCPHCGGSFGPPDFMTYREVSRVEPKEQPTGLMTPWALNFLDAINGEVLLAADRPDENFNFSLILTDRRLIVLSPLDILAGIGNKPHDWVIPDRHFITWPLQNLTSIEAKSVDANTTQMTIKTDTGEIHTWKTWPFDNMAGYITNALPNATRPLIFPEDEQVYFDGGANLGILDLTDQKSPLYDSELLAAHFFNRSARLSLAVTNHRLLFYRINHIHEMAWMSGGSLNVKMGAPVLPFISLPWDALRRIVVSSGFLGGSVSLVLDQPVWAWTSPGLKVLPYDSIKCQYETRTCARCGEAIYGGVGPQRKDLSGNEINSSVVGSYCSTCDTAYHKSCLKTLEKPAGKCPTCGQPRQVIDLGYYNTTFPLQAVPVVTSMVSQINIPPVGKSGEEWKLTLTKNVKAWETFILPAVRKANPQVQIEGK